MAVQVLTPLVLRGLKFGKILICMIRNQEGIYVLRRNFQNLLAILNRGRDLDLNKIQLTS